MPSLTTSLPFSPAELAYLHTSLSSTPPLRPDAISRSTDFRPLRAETGVLPAVNGSAHVGFSDGREAIVGVKLEVEKTVTRRQNVTTREENETMEVDEADLEEPGAGNSHGNAQWLSTTLTLPGLRDDDPNLIFLEEMLREPLIVSGLADRLMINSKWHWHAYVDILLVSPNGLASYPLPLLSTAVHLALRDTRIPKLKSEGEEDPVADDDWMASTFLYAPGSQTRSTPPVTLLVVVVGENVVFDPIREELAVADSVVAVSVGRAMAEEGEGRQEGDDEDDGRHSYKVLAVRMIDTPARDTMKGVPLTGEAPEGADVPGVWKPRLGGVKRTVMKNVVKSVTRDGVAKDVFMGLDGFFGGQG